MKLTNTQFIAISLGIILFATSLRMISLDTQSFWNDEGNSARIAERSPDLIVAGAAADIHPPGYYLLLAGWRALLGPSEFSLRLFSVVAGVALVAVIIGLGQQYFGRLAGLWAGALAALHPALVYYSQEARMYSLLGLLAALTLLLMSRWLLRTRSLSLTAPPVIVLSAVYLLVATYGLYTHYAYPLALLAVNIVAVLGVMVHRRANQRTRLIGWLGLNVLASLLFLPWLPTAWRQISTWPAGGAEVGLPTAALKIWGWLVAGNFLIESLTPLILFLAVALVVLAFTSRGQYITPLLAWAIPTLIFLVAGLYSETTLKFLIVAVPGLLVLMAGGIANNLAHERDQRGFVQLTSLGGLLVLIAFGFGLSRVYSDPAFARADYRQIAADIQAFEQPGDAILLNAPNQWEVFTYYYPDGPNVYPVARSRPLDVTAQEDELAEIVSRHERLFAIYWGEAQSDPERVVESWLNRNTYTATSHWYGDVRVVTYAVPSVANTPTTPDEMPFGEQITLLGHTLANPQARPGDILQVTLFWQTNALINTRYNVFLHLTPELDAQPLAQRDSEPGGGMVPTITWQPGETLHDNHGIYLPPDLPPGDYYLLVGLYGVGTFNRLTNPNGDNAYLLSRVQVLP